MDGERAQISARQAIESAKIATERMLEEERIARERGIQSLEIERRKHLELAEQQRAIAIAQQSKAQSEAQAEADRARAGAVSEEERVFTVRETEVAERRKSIELIAASQEAEREGVRLRVAAAAEKAVAMDRGAAIRAEAEAESDADRIRALAYKVRAEIEAEGTRLMNAAQNTLSSESRLSLLRMRLVEKLDAIIREQVRPLERIESIKIMHVDGLTSGGHGHGANGYEQGGGAGGFAENVVNSALRYRAQAPLVDQLLKEIGVQGGDVGSVAQGLLAGAAAGEAGRLPGLDPDPSAQ
jgi:uncharacterized membrane protein YqiK